MGAALLAQPDGERCGEHEVIMLPVAPDAIHVVGGRRELDLEVE